MKKLLLIIFSLTLINCEKDGVGEDDPIRATWLGEVESEDYNGDTAYFQVVYKFNDDLLYTKSKFSVNNIDTYEPEEQPVSWKNNDPDCIPFKCVNYDSVNQDYTIDGEIVNIVFTNDFKNFINDGIEFKRQAEDIYWNNF